MGHKSGDGVTSVEGKRSERFPVKSLNLENSPKSDWGSVSSKEITRHFSYESNEQFLDLLLKVLKNELFNFTDVCKCFCGHLFHLPVCPLKKGNRDRWDNGTWNVLYIFVLILIDGTTQKHVLNFQLFPSPSRPLPLSPTSIVFPFLFQF
jgi:hypothetical protein